MVTASDAPWRVGIVLGRAADAGAGEMVLPAAAPGTTDPNRSGHSGQHADGEQTTPVVSRTHLARLGESTDAAHLGARGRSAPGALRHLALSLGQARLAVC
jgi:hypothetical protein